MPNIEISFAKQILPAFLTLVRTTQYSLTLLGVYQTDVTFIQDGNPDYLDESKTIINFFKRRLFAEVIKEIQTYQLKSYNFVPVEMLLPWLSGQEANEFTEENLYNMSLEVEPRDGAGSVKGTTKKALAPDGSKNNSKLSFISSNDSYPFV